MEQGIGLNGSFTVKAHVDFGRSIFYKSDLCSLIKWWDRIMGGYMWMVGGKVKVGICVYCDYFAYFLIRNIVPFIVPLISDNSLVEHVL
jgi:hypothetical protein